MKLEAIRRKAGRPAKTKEKADENNSPQVAANFRADDTVAKDAGISGDTVRRYIRLTELSPELQQMVDEKKIGMTPAVEISYLKPEEQQMLLTAIDSEQATPSLSQAQRMKMLSREGKPNDDSMLDIMMEQKKPEKNDITLILKQREESYKRLEEAKATAKYMDDKVAHYEAILAGLAPDDTNPKNWTAENRPAH